MPHATKATCVSPTDMKLLWESLEWLYRHICKHCGELGIRRPRNKYRNVAESYLGIRLLPRRHVLSDRIFKKTQKNGNKKWHIEGIEPNHFV